MAVDIGRRQFKSAPGDTAAAWPLSKIITMKLVSRGLSDR
jgi:hypothetical protein